MNIAGVVILYYPDQELKQRLNTYSSRLKKLYIIDNSDRSQKSSILEDLNNPLYSITHTGENRGISERLNEAASQAIKEGFDWLLTMDQDSYFDPNVFDQYISCIHTYTNYEKTAVFGIEYDIREVKPWPCSLKKVDQVITSGSIINLSLFDIIGGFDEALFIDNVDHEYCYRAKLKGFEIIKVENLLLKHSLGIKSHHRSFKNLKITQRTLHSPVRLYYMVRNYLYLRDKYKEAFPDDLRLVGKNLFFSIKNNLLYNHTRTKVFQYILKGYIHYKRGKMGKLS